MMDKFDAIVRGKKHGPFTAPNKEIAKSMIYYTLVDQHVYENLDISEVIVSEPTQRNANG